MSVASASPALPAGKIWARNEPVIFPSVVNCANRMRRSAPDTAFVAEGRVYQPEPTPSLMAMLPPAAKLVAQALVTPGGIGIAAISPAAPFAGPESPMVT